MKPSLKFKSLESSDDHPPKIGGVLSFLNGLWFVMKKASAPLKPMLTFLIGHEAEVELESGKQLAVTTFLSKHSYRIQSIKRVVTSPSPHLLLRLKQFFSGSEAELLCRNPQNRSDMVRFHPYLYLTTQDRLLLPENMTHENLEHALLPGETVRLDEETKQPKQYKMPVTVFLHEAQKQLKQSATGLDEVFQVLHPGQLSLVARLNEAMTITDHRGMRSKNWWRFGKVLAILFGIGQGLVASGIIFSLLTALVTWPLTLTISIASYVFLHSASLSIRQLWVALSSYSVQNSLFHFQYSDVDYWMAQYKKASPFVSLKRQKLSQKVLEATIFASANAEPDEVAHRIAQLRLESLAEAELGSQKLALLLQQQYEAQCAILVRLLTQKLLEDPEKLRVATEIWQQEIPGEPQPVNIILFIDQFLQRIYFKNEPEIITAAVVGNQHLLDIAYRLINLAQPSRDQWTAEKKERELRSALRELQAPISIKSTTLMVAVGLIIYITVLFETASVYFFGADLFSALLIQCGFLIAPTLPMLLIASGFKLALFNWMINKSSDAVRRADWEEWCAGVGNKPAWIVLFLIPIAIFSYIGFDHYLRFSLDSITEVLSTYLPDFRELIKSCVNFIFSLVVVPVSMLFSWDISYEIIQEYGFSYPWSAWQTERIELNELAARSTWPRLIKGVVVLLSPLIFITNLMRFLLEKLFDSRLIQALGFGAAAGRTSLLPEPVLNLVANTASASFAANAWSASIPNTLPYMKSSEWAAQYRSENAELNLFHWLKPPPASQKVVSGFAPDPAAAPRL